MRMALPPQIGDRVVFFEDTVGLQPKALTEANERLESTVSVAIRAHPDNAAGSVLFIGDAQLQPWPLGPGEAFSIAVTKRSLIYVRGSAEGVRYIVGEVLTTGKLPVGRVGF